MINNWRKHREDRSDVTQHWHIDWYASGAMFPDWKERGQPGFSARPPELAAHDRPRAEDVVPDPRLDDPRTDLVPRGPVGGTLSLGTHKNSRAMSHGGRLARPTGQRS